MIASASVRSGGFDGPDGKVTCVKGEKKVASCGGAERSAVRARARERLLPVRSVFPVKTYIYIEIYCAFSASGLPTGLLTLTGNPSTEAA